MAISTKSAESLDDIVARLVEGLKPDRIYLFGSQASGQAGPDSDFDLLVVVSESDLPRHQREKISYDLLWGLRTSVDVIVLTQEEFQRAIRVKTSLASSARDHGKRLYG
ncbi:MAG TPA: nucleotidyltransferase domain-containing protein [Anaerolineales bacterium]|nr:nucleotidyltransferase domain-containing protein [Anaerolineales bacterium]